MRGLMMKMKLGNEKVSTMKGYIGPKRGLVGLSEKRKWAAEWAKCVESKPRNSRVSAAKRNVAAGNEPECRYGYGGLSKLSLAPTKAALMKRLK